MFRGFFNDPFYDTGSFFNDSQKDDGESEMAVGRPPNHHRMMSPFGMMDSFASSQSSISDMNGFMDLGRKMSEQFMDPSKMMDNDNGFGYSSMKVQSYVKDGSGQPKTYEAEKSTRFAPGIKHEKKSVRDSERGDKMSVGRHLGDQAHVVTKSRNRGSQNIREGVDYRGFNQNEQSRFDQEWQQKAQQFQQHQGYLPQPRDKGNRLRDETLKHKRLSLKEA